MPTPHRLKEIARLEEQIAALQAALAQLRTRRAAIRAEIELIGADVEKLSGRPPARGKRKARRRTDGGAKA
jgi:cell division protein FtsB